MRFSWLSRLHLPIGVGVPKLDLVVAPASGGWSSDMRSSMSFPWLPCLRPPCRVCSWDVPKRVSVPTGHPTGSGSPSGRLSSAAALNGLSSRFTPAVLNGGKSLRRAFRWNWSMRLSWLRVCLAFLPVDVPDIDLADIPVSQIMGGGALGASRVHPSHGHHAGAYMQGAFIGRTKISHFAVPPRFPALFNHITGSQLRPLTPHNGERISQWLAIKRVP
jgi:hypothetical protein